MTWATYVPILVFLGLSFYRLRPDVRYRQTSDRLYVYSASGRVTRVLIAALICEFFRRLQSVSDDYYVDT